MDDDQAAHAKDTEPPLDQSDSDDDDEEDGASVDAVDSLPSPHPQQQLDGTGRLKQGTLDGYLGGRKGAAVPSSVSLLWSVLSFVWYVLKWTLLIACLSSLLFLPLLFLALSSSYPSMAEGLQHLSTSLPSLLSSLTSHHPNPSSISSSASSSLPSTIQSLSLHYPTLHSALTRTLQPLLAAHFNPSHLTPHLPLVVFLAHIPTPSPFPSPSSTPSASPSPSPQAFAASLASHLYPPAIPPYLLPLPAPLPSAQRLESVLRGYFGGREDGLVYVGGVGEAGEEGRKVGVVLQKWCDVGGAGGSRGVWVLDGEVREEELKAVGWGGKRGTETAYVKRAVRRRMQQGEDDQLVDAMLERLVRNVMVVR